MSSFRRARRAVVLALILLASYPTPSHGWSYQIHTTDHIVLMSDAIIFGSVLNISQVAGRPSLFDLTLGEIRIVTNRLALGTPTIRIRVRGSRLAEGRISWMPGAPSIDRNSRYLFFLRGGPWVSAPFLSDAMPVYPVSNDVVRCSGGEIYSISPTGLVCSTRDRQWGEPLSEVALARSLGEWNQAARVRSPSDAARYDRDTSPLQVDEVRE